MDVTTREELSEFLELIQEIELGEATINVLADKVRAKRQRTNMLIAKYGCSGKAFKIGDVIILASQASEYANLRIILTEE